MIYFLLVLSVVTASGKALFGKALGLRGASLKKSLFLNFQAFAVSLIFSLIFTIPKLGGFSLSLLTR